MASAVKIFTGSASRYLAQQICHEYGIPLGKEILMRFADGEFQPSYEETLRGHEVYIVQSTFQPAENILELLLMIDAARRASAKQVIAVIPYFGLGRQDRKDKPRVPIGAKLMANLLTAAGVNRVITMDLHADQIQGFFDVPVDHLYASTIFVPYIKSLDLPNLVIGSPDTGGTRRAATYAKFVNGELVICYKQRLKANKVERMMLIGDVKGKNVILVDDIIDTAGSIIMAGEMVMENGANSVRAVCTHPVFSKNAVERLNDSVFSEIIVSDTIPLTIESPKITVLSTAKLFANVIERVHSHQSISTHYGFSTMT
ncbi:MAG TPA: ribose-phosphate pyrophosphokinase [Bacteroidales bacterium]|nr:ribose-phosphate pyrophosphokinase [Bacteroidales bacterium]